MLMKMNRETEEKVIMLLRTLAKQGNWAIQKITDVDGNWIRNELLWEKQHYDPMYVAQDLIEEIKRQ